MQPITDHNQCFIGLNENYSYVEEGQFVNDELDNTFGRRIKIDGSIKIGWFQGDGRYLHGYGRIVNSTNNTK